jgi:5-methylcytosine-specific restriction endonuclease McrA
MNVFVVDTNRNPLNPIHPARARKLLSSGQAAVLKRYPFTIVLKYAVAEPAIRPLRIKLDPGSRTTGIALVNDASGEVVIAAELSHRGLAVKEHLLKRKRARRARRHRHTRYRPARWQNRRCPKGWLAPSLQSRVNNVVVWVRRFMRLCPINAISMELVRFDTQAMQNPEIQGTEYQCGTLVGYEAKQYLLEKWQRTCVYCDKQGIPLQVEHIVPRAKGGSNRISNLTLACQKCNEQKGDQDIHEFLKQQPKRLARILAQTKVPLRDVAAVNTTRWNLYERLKQLGLPIECGSGGRTKWNRTRQGLPKNHWCDAACIGASTPSQLDASHVAPLAITAMGRQRRQMCLVDKHGFTRSKAKKTSLKHSFRTGDIVCAVVPARLNHAGVHVGRMSSKASGTFTITTAQGPVTDIGYRYCTRLQRADGYAYLLKGGCGFLPFS